MAEMIDEDTSLQVGSPRRWEPTVARLLFDDSAVTDTGSDSSNEMASSTNWTGQEALFDRVDDTWVTPHWHETGGWVPYRVMGAPGTGKTSLLVDIAVHRIQSGADPESIAVLVPNRSAMRDVSARIASASSGRDGACREPLVRTIHSYAFAVLRLHAQRAGNPPPRLITSSQQDAVIREILAGDLEDGALYWPERLRPALTTAGFASALRDFMLRAAERGLGPEDIIAMGRRAGRDDWVAAGKAYEQYEGLTLLRGAVGMAAPTASAPVVDAAELVDSAVTALSVNPDLLEEERARVRYLLVDDAQHLDPHAGALVRLIGSGADKAVIAGDPDQRIYSWRGASEVFFESLAERGSERDIVLGRGFRLGGEIFDLARRLSTHLAGASYHRTPSAPDSAIEGGSTPTVEVDIFSSTAKEAAAIADSLRRSHIDDGVAWSEMAVICRSAAMSLDALRRGLTLAGVPIRVPRNEVVAHNQRAVTALLHVLAALDADLDRDTSVALLASPIGGSDPAKMRRLQRGVRRSELARGIDRNSAEGLAELINSMGAPGGGDWRARIADMGLSDVEAAPLLSVGKVVSRAAEVRDNRGTVEEILWAAWHSTSLARLWSALSERGGTAGQQADRDLDAVLALFDMAASYTDGLPSFQLRNFRDYVAAQQIPVTPRAREIIDDAVSLMTAHSAAGMQWRVVAVAGVQDGIWPSLRQRGSILGVSDFVDVASGLDPNAIHTLWRGATLLNEERRLLYVACTRASEKLLITAVDSGEGEAQLVPSRFLDELLRAAAGTDDVSGSTIDGALPPVDAKKTTLLALSPMVARLRAAVCAPIPADADHEQIRRWEVRRARAARELAKLAEAKVVGAHPDSWYGLAGVTTTEPLWAPESGPIVLSPSKLDSILTCPLKWALESLGGSDAHGEAAINGTLVHTLLQAAASGVPTSEVSAQLRRAWPQLNPGANWFSRKECERHEAMIDYFADWYRATRDDLTLVDVEAQVSARLDHPTHPVMIRGRIDRLEKDTAGRPVVIDLKTGKRVPTASELPHHPQLMTYQVAIAHGGLTARKTHLREAEMTVPGGGRLVYVSKPHTKTGATERIQAPYDAEALASAREVIHGAAASTTGPIFAAHISEQCQMCPVRSSCPAHAEGKAVTDD